MTLPVAPSSIAFDQINTELGNPSNSVFSMNFAPARSLAGVPVSNSQISMSNFYGKSATPPVGCFYCGGYLMGTTCSEPSGQVYYLIAAPLPAGTPGVPNPNPACTSWCQPCPIRCNAGPCPLPAPLPGTCAGSWNVDTYMGCLQDGYRNTRCSYNAPAAGCPTSCTTPFLNNTTPVQGGQYPMFQWAVNLSICGYSDWYIPAWNEMQQMWVNAHYVADSSGQGFPHLTQNACPTCGFPTCIPGCYPLGQGCLAGGTSTQVVCAPSPTASCRVCSAQFQCAYCRPYPPTFIGACATSLSFKMQNGIIGTAWYRAVRREPCA